MSTSESANIGASEGPESTPRGTGAVNSSSDAGVGSTAQWPHLRIMPTKTLNRIWRPNNRDLGVASWRSQADESTAASRKRTISNVLDLICLICVVVGRIVIFTLNCFATFGKAPWAEFKTNAIFFGSGTAVASLGYLLQRIRKTLPEFDSDLFLGLEPLNSVTGLVTSFINLVITFVALIRHQEIKTLT
ncbi:hypothetical protein TWF106_009584 [Orbilia oligospora]|uniref:Uncharacterized protein n=1 Tax=Orbilia oligospora TaxID=2813651 RepID=A0A7C8UMD3_ORBOL|nr:hypothetical protein TWF788_004531 [Orbilia oligospora]KAF3194623.1 hypothetical protein TWF679_007225 [Orbilia oligospora]KAF3213295.1 hypothetical protein TWF106_009584 [Orbilia oligospora]